MKKYITIFLILSSNLLIANASIYKPSGIEFIENRGQFVDENGKAIADIKYVATTEGKSLYVRNSGISFVFSKFEEDTTAEIDSNMLMMGIDAPAGTMSYHRMDMNLVGADFSAKVSGMEKLSQYNNYYYPHCPDGITNVPVYAKVKYEEVYDEIDFVLYTKENVGLEYDFVVKPGGDPSKIRLKFEEAENAAISKEGSLIAENILGKIEQLKPYTYQKINGEKKEVKSAFKLNPNGEISFELEDYDKSEELVIDPITRVWATYYGGSLDDFASGIINDYDNNVIICGSTLNSNGGELIATAGSFQEELANGLEKDGFIAKFDTDGNRLWSTYYGGTMKDAFISLAVDKESNIVICGHSDATNEPNLFGTPGVHKEQYEGIYFDVILSKFNPVGTRIWSTYFGGKHSEICQGVTIDKYDNIIITGGTSSETGIAFGNADLKEETKNNSAFCAKFTKDATILWGTYIGGDDRDCAMSVAVDSISNVFVTGYTLSDKNISTSDGFQFLRGGSVDAFLIKYSSTGDKIWGTYFGGYNQENYLPMDSQTMVAVDRDNNIVLAGTTFSTEDVLTTKDAYQKDFGGGFRDAYVVKFDNNCNRIWSTFVGGTSDDGGLGVAIDRNSNIYVCGFAHSKNYTTNIIRENIIATDDAIYDSQSGEGDGFIEKFDKNGKRLYGTYYGGKELDYFSGISIDYRDNLYFIGHTESINNIFSGNGHQSSYYGDDDVFVLKISDPSIMINSIKSSFVESQKIKVKYTSEFTESKGKYILLLSDSSGQFNVPYIFENFGTLGGTLSDYLPDDIPYSEKYRFRVDLIDGTDTIIGLPTEESYTIYPKPDLNIAGKREVVQSETVEYSVNNMVIISNNWKVTGGDIKSETDSPTIEIEWTEAGSGKIKLIRTIDEISYSDSTEIEIKIYEKPEMTFEYESETCQDDTVNYSVPENEDAINNWQLTGGSVIGENDKNEVSVRWTEPGEGSIKLIREIESAEYKDSVINLVTVNPRPAKPSISREENTLVSSAETGNQWYESNILIQEATNQEFTPEHSGFYSVIKINEFGCDSEMSDSIEYNKTEVQKKNYKYNALFYPNPTTNYLTINIDDVDFLDKNLSVNIYTTMGKMMICEKYNWDIAKNCKIDISKLPKGCYIARIICGKWSYEELIIKD